jgi:hypothetical protein
MPDIRDHVFEAGLSQLSMATESLDARVKWMDKVIRILRRQEQREKQLAMKHRERLVVDLINDRITLDGIVYESQDHKANVFLEQLRRANGLPVTQGELVKMGLLKKTNRPGRLYSNLPRAIQRFVELKPGFGSRLLVDQLQRV